MGSGVIRRGFDPGLNGKYVPQQILAQNRFRCAGGDDPALLHDDQFVAEHRGMVEIVKSDDAGDGQAGNQPHQADLVLDVEMVGGLIEDQFLRRLRQGARDMSALFFAARQALPSIIAFRPHAGAF